MGQIVLAWCAWGGLGLLLWVRWEPRRVLEQRSDMF